MNEDGGANKSSGKDSRTGTSRSPRDGQDKAFDSRNALVENRVQRCMAFQASTHLPESSMEPLKTSELQEGPWQHVDIDFCGQFPSGDYLLVAIAEYSPFPEVKIITSTSAYSTIPKLDKIFSTHGVPEVVKSDMDLYSKALN